MLSVFQFPEETCVDENDRQGPARSQVTMMSLTGEIVMIVRKPEKVILSSQPSIYSTSKYSNDLPEIDVSTVLEGSLGELHKIPAN